MKRMHTNKQKKDNSPRPMIGLKFGKLMVLSEVIPHERKHRQFQCVCDCGNLLVTRGCYLRNGSTKSCGCLKKERFLNGEIILSPKFTTKKHGHSFVRYGLQTGTYRSWQAMRQRCTNPKASAYKNYGAKGVTVCERWSSFENFLADMGERPDGYSIDRIDPCGPYDPSNCRWADRTTQANNKRKNKAVKI